MLLDGNSVIGRRLRKCHQDIRVAVLKNADKKVVTNKNNKLRRSTTRVEDSWIIRIFVADKKESWQPEKINFSMKQGDIKNNVCYVLLGVQPFDSIVWGCSKVNLPSDFRLSQ